MTRGEGRGIRAVATREAVGRSRSWRSLPGRVSVAAWSVRPSVFVWRSNLAARLGARSRHACPPQSIAINPWPTSPSGGTPPGGPSRRLRLSFCYRVSCVNSNLRFFSRRRGFCRRNSLLGKCAPGGFRSIQPLAARQHHGIVVAAATGYAGTADLTDFQCATEFVGVALHHLFPCLVTSRPCLWCSSHFQILSKGLVSLRPYVGRQRGRVVVPSWPVAGLHPHHRPKENRISFGRLPTQSSRLQSLPLPLDSRLCCTCLRDALPKFGCCNKSIRWPVLP